MQFPLHVKLYCNIHKKEHIRKKLEKEESLNIFMFHKNFTALYSHITFGLAYYTTVRHFENHSSKDKNND